MFLMICMDLTSLSNSSILAIRFFIRFLGMILFVFFARIYSSFRYCLILNVIVFMSFTGIIYGFKW
jgi:hypothetical protein